MKTVIIFALVWVACLGSAVMAQEPVSIDALYQIDQLPVLRHYAWAYQSSSHDRGFRNYDWTGFLGWRDKQNAPNEKTVMDVKGPGCVYRIWFTSNSTDRYGRTYLNGTLRFYLDGSTTPVAIPMEQFFGGGDPRFPSPLVGNQTVSSGGYYSYVPIPFRTGCMITHDNIADLTYFNITYHRFASADGLTTWNGPAPPAALVTQWRNAGSDPKPSQGNQRLTGTLNVPANNGVTTLTALNGPGIIQRLEFNLPSVNQATLSSLSLRVTCDGRSTVADVPIGSFFGSGLAPGTVNGLTLGMQGGRLYCYYPMPYRKRIQIDVVNTSSAAVGNVGYTLEYVPRDVPSSMGLLYAEHYERDHLPEFFDYNFATCNGTGHMVGVVQSSKGRFNGQWYLEGDERFYVDGSLTPAAHGTGTEDFYNAGWYFQNGLFSRPLHGHPSHTGNDKTLCTDACYRFFIGDLIPYRDYLRAGIEHGGWNEDPVDIESVTFSYKSPRSSMFLTDTVDVGNQDSQTAHGYGNTNVLLSDSLTAAYASNGDSATATDTGVRIGMGGTSHFTISTNPTGSYVVLRRRLDYSIPRQQAEVKVNGVVAGIWYDAGSAAADGSRIDKAPAFRDSEFFIPPSLSQGQTSLNIEITNTSTESEWTEYTYWAYVVRDSSIVPADFDTDGDVDLTDFSLLQQCMTGDLVPQTNPNCAITRMDVDADVDTNDASIFLNCMSGAGNPADPNCADQ